MTYILDRYYSGEIEKETKVIKSNYTLEEMLDIIGLIIVFYKEYRKLPGKCKIENIQDILVKIFGAKDVMHKYERELPFIYTRLSCKVLFQGYDLSGKLVTWLDIDEIEERYRGKNVSLLIKKYLSEEQKERIITYIRELG